MYNQELVSQSVKHLKSRIENKTAISNNLYVVDDILLEAAYYKLIEYIDASPPWTEQESSGYENNPLRVKVAWEADTIIEELNDIFSGVTKNISEMLGTKAEFLGVTLWKDSPDYQLGWHTDNEIIIATFQTYINNRLNPGTTFKVDENREYECKFLPNTGYISCHNSLLHKLEPVANERYSLLAMWGKPGSKI